MAELNLKQIIDKLNTEFTGDVRKLVFWYDAGAEFAEDVDNMQLDNAKVYHLQPDNQFYTKYFLECVDTTTNYLIYAPFAKPAIRENHLADTIKYSKEFFADRASLLMLDLGMDERYKPVIQHYIKFFGEKKRTQAFYDLGIEVYNKNTIEIGLMSVLCKCKIPSYEEVLRIVLTDGGMEENAYLKEFEKYGLQQAFWRMATDQFGYADHTPTLEKLLMTMFITYADKVISTDLPVAWDPYVVSFKAGNTMAFLDNLMNNDLYGKQFDVLSKQIYDSLKGNAEFAKLPVEALVGCGIFAGIDELLIGWATERLELEDVAAKLGNVTIPELAKMRRTGHFGRQYRAQYFVLENAWHIISGVPYEPTNSLQALAKNYSESLYQMDRRYRYFYYFYDKLEDNQPFEQLKELVENIYANAYLTKLCVNWNDLFQKEAATLPMMKQPDFYNQNVQLVKEQLVVIISDAMRYEVGMSLLEKLQADEKCSASMKPMLSVLPSVTSYGMAALLPHQSLELTDDYAVLVDGRKTDSLEQRQAVLQQYKPASRCIQYDEIKGLSIAELRNIFNKQDVVYIYHNQIDARGDKLSTENEVFDACMEAVEEISALIRRLTNSVSRSRYLITADHGFLYRRNRVMESDKIASVTAGADTVGRRYVLSDNGIVAEGVASTELGLLMKHSDKRMVSYPIGADIFKAPGAGVNYVHGGCSPQEMLVPLIEVKTIRSHKETSTVQISLVSQVSKITNLITALDFMQTEPISDVVKETTYRIYFITENGEKISNEHLHKADSREADAVKRIFKLRFVLKNDKYNKAQKYYLVAYDENNGLEVLRQEIIMDIAFADDFDFGF